MDHPLHKVIGKIIYEKVLPDCKILRDPACRGKQNISLFSSKRKSKETEYCNVDILILKSNKIRVIIEIEETDVKPTQIFGKFLTSALSSNYIHRNEKAVDMGDPALFVQILDISKLKRDKTRKIKQWLNIEKSIQNVIPLKESKIKRYKLFYGNISEFGNKGDRKHELIAYIQKFLREIS
jgi:hypothetical protein